MVKWLVAAVAAGFAFNLIIRPDSPLDSNGKFLGFFEESSGFGLDDVAKGGAIVALASLAGMAAHKFSGGAIPQGVKV